MTPRQRDILRLMADGLVKKEITDALNISVTTVSTHLQRVYERLHVTTNTGAVAKAPREKLIQLSTAGSCDPIDLDDLGPGRYEPGSIVLLVEDRSPQFGSFDR